MIFGYVLNKVSWLYGQQAGDNTLQKVLDTINGIGGAFKNPLPSIQPRDLLVGIGCGIGFRMVVYYKAKNAKKFRQGVEYGSARWGTAKDIEPYVDPVFENNVLLTATERLMMSGRPKQPKYARNKNIYKMSRPNVQKILYKNVQLVCHQACAGSPRPLSLRNQIQKYLTTMDFLRY